MERRTFFNKISTLTTLAISSIWAVPSKDKYLRNSLSAELDPLLEHWKEQMLYNIGRASASNITLVEQYIQPATKPRKETTAGQPVYSFENIHGHKIRIEVSQSDPAIYSFQI